MNKQALNRLIHILLSSSALICFTVLLFLLIILIGNGIQSLSLDFILSPAEQFGAAGGIFFQILGSLLLIFTTILITLPLAIGTALFKSEYLTNNRLQQFSNTLLYNLNGIPSIIFGLFGLIFFINILGMNTSWLIGSVILSMMILPTVTLAAFQSMHSLPGMYRENAYALGLNQWQAILRVILPQGISGAVSGLFIGLARAIGETAPILFVATAFSGINLPHSFTDPVVALPTHILVLAQHATHPQSLHNAWGSSLILLLLVFTLTIMAYISRQHLLKLNQR